MFQVKLSQEHSTLPVAELNAVIETCYPDENVVLEFNENIVKITGLNDISELKNRLAYAMEIDGVELGQGFDARYSRNRPFSYPTTLDPKLARCMVNLARPQTPNLKPPTPIFDPFCGTGGILLEAGLMGFKTIGIDIDEKMIAGCKQNLEHYGVSGFDISVEDFFKTKKQGIIVTDPPYGKNTIVSGQTIEEFYNLILERLYKITTGISCIGSPNTINLSEMARNQGFKILEEHIVFVNKDMSKRILVLEK
jgi:tRNA (guanine10-N2)-dimethyltransferase